MIAAQNRETLTLSGFLSLDLVLLSDLYLGQASAPAAVAGSIVGVFFINILTSEEGSLGAIISAIAGMFAGVLLGFGFLTWFP